MCCCPMRLTRPPLPIFPPEWMAAWGGRGTGCAAEETAGTSDGGGGNPPPGEHEKFMNDGAVESAPKRVKGGFKMCKKMII